MPTFVGTRIRCHLFVGLLVTAIATPASAAEHSVAKLCGFSPQEWSTNLALATEQRRGTPLPFTYWNLADAVCSRGDRIKSGWTAFGSRCRSTRNTAVTSASRRSSMMCGDSMQRSSSTAAIPRPDSSITAGMKRGRNSRQIRAREDPARCGRAVGWYAMSLVDVLDAIPEGHAARPYLMRLLTDIVESVVRYQDRDSGLWYEVVDQPKAAGNYLESSGTSMFAYAIARGVNKGYLDKRFSSSAVRGYVGLIRDKVEIDSQGRWSLIDIVQSAGLGAPPTWPPGSPPPRPRDASPRGRPHLFLVSQ